MRRSGKRTRRGWGGVARGQYGAKQAPVGGACTKGRDWVLSCARCGSRAGLGYHVIYRPEADMFIPTIPVQEEQRRPRSPFLSVFRLFAPTAATVAYAVGALEVIPSYPDNLPLLQDGWISWATFGLSLLLMWLLLCAVCAGLRLAAHRLHWVPRWIAYLALLPVGWAVPLLTATPAWVLVVVCDGQCAWAGYKAHVFINVSLNFVAANKIFWPMIVVLMLCVAVWLALLELRLFQGGHRGEPSPLPSDETT